MGYPPAEARGCAAPLAGPHHQRRGHRACAARLRARGHRATAPGGPGWRSMSGQGSPGRDPRARPGGHVRRGRFVGCRGPAGGGRARRGGRVDAPARCRRHLQRQQPLLLLARCGRGCPARGRPAGHPLLRAQPRARVRGRRAGAVLRRLPRGPHAQPLRRLQLAGQVRGAAGPGPPPLRLRRGGHRPLRAHRAAPGPRRRATGCATGSSAGRDAGQGPDLLPLRA